MTLIMPPTTGEDVTILAQDTRLSGYVTDRSREGLTIGLEQGPIRRPFRFPAGSEVSVEWVHALGVMHLTATVESAEEEPVPTLQLRPSGSAEPVERRRHERIPVELEASAWTLSQPTRRLSGNTVDLSVGGALLWLPDLNPLAATVEVRIDLPQKPVQVSTSVRWRRDPALVGVRFERISPDDQARLVSFLRESR